MTIDTVGAGGAARPLERQSGSADAVIAGSAARAATAAAIVNGKAGADTPTLDQVNQAVAALNQSPQARSQGLEFSIDSDTKRTVVKVIDQSTQEVLRQIPTPEALEIAKALEATSNNGWLIRQTA